MDTNRKIIYISLRTKMEEVGFVFEKEQSPHHQNRKEKELKFIHPSLVEKLELNGNKVRAKKFYIKPLTNKHNCEIGLVTGKSSPLLDTTIFSKANDIDKHNDAPAWVNKENDKSLDDLLRSINTYLGRNNNWSEEELKEAVGIDIFSIKPFISEDSYQDAVQASDPKTIAPGPAPKKTQKTKGGNNSWSRNAGISKAALERAGYQCEVDKTHLTFISKSSGQQFMEAHHLIPMEYQNDFTYSIDVPENIVSLCPNCHRKVHLSVTAEKMPLIEKLFYERTELLRNRGIEIDLNKIQFIFQP